MAQAAFILAMMLLLYGCDPAARYVELPLVALPSFSGASSEAGAPGILRIPASVQQPVELQIALRGLSPGSDYVLCLNSAEHGTDTSQALGTLAIPGWPLGRFFPVGDGRDEGYWDFQTIQANASGEFSGRVQLPLPPLDYRVKFLVKQRHERGATSILGSDPILIEVKDGSVFASFAFAMLAIAGMATLAALTWRSHLLRLLRLLRLVRLVRRSSSSIRFGRSRLRVAQTASGGGREEGTRETSVVETLLLTRVARARAEGELLHDPAYAWVEIHGRRKQFRPRQAFVFQILCEEDPDCVGLSQAEILKEWRALYGATQARSVRVRDILRSCDDEPGDFIERVPGVASTYRLRLDAPLERIADG